MAQLVPFTILPDVGFEFVQLLLFDWTGLQQIDERAGRRSAKIPCHQRLNRELIDGLLGDERPKDKDAASALMGDKILLFLDAEQGLGSLVVGPLLFRMSFDDFFDGRLLLLPQSRQKAASRLPLVPEVPVFPCNPEQFLSHRGVASTS
jgi:hypothetical protein